MILALTMGEPAGAGPELAAKAWHALRGAGPGFVFLGDAGLITGAPVRRVGTPEEAGAAFRHALPVIHRPLPAPSAPGRPDPRNAPAVIASIEDAVALARAGRVGGVVTLPIQKATLTAAGFPHPGHTEFLGALAGTGVPPVMMLCCPELRVVPVTVHEPLRTAIARLTPALIAAHARVAHAALRRDFGVAAPRLAVAGLNPHAGEAGTLGGEDAAIIAPAVAMLRAEGIAATGPHPPDTLFTPRARRGYDCAIGMYHDQALIPLKTLDVDGGVNVTLGLSVVRTSPDHGTALDIAGTGRADPGSLLAAIRLAARITRNREETCGSR